MDTPEAPRPASLLQGGSVLLELGKEHVLTVERFRVDEAISALFEIVVIARTTDAGIDFDTVVGQAATLVVNGLSRRIWKGLCIAIEQLETEDDGLTTYSLRIGPALWRLTQRRNIRVFQHKNVVEIGRALLAEWGVPAEWRVDPGAFPKYEYRVQYGETDFAFFARILADAGLSYFFVGGRGDEGHETRVVVSNAPERATARPQPVPFDDAADPATAREHVKDARVLERVPVGRFTFRDHDVRHPRFELFGKARSGDASERLEHYAYAPGSALVEVAASEGGTPAADAKSIARHDAHELTKRAALAMQAEMSAKRTFSFETNAMDLAPGTVFSIVDHPHPSLADDTKLLVVASHLSGRADGKWLHVCDARDARLAFRTPLLAKPVVEGLQNAVVVGPDSQEIHTDELGRVRVKFPWDREGRFDDDASTWLRLSQGAAGAGFGMMQIPRAGSEVLVGFMDGDPDHPVVVGSLFNASQRPPAPLPEGGTKSVWRTHSSPHVDGAYNELSFDDAADKELVLLRAERDLQKTVRGRETERTGESKSTVVGGERKTIVAEVDSFHFGAERRIAIANIEDVQIERDVSAAPTTTSVRITGRNITLTTGLATIALEGPTIRITSAGAIRMAAQKDLVIIGDLSLRSDATNPEKPADRVREQRIPRARIGAVRRLFPGKRERHERDPHARARHERDPHARGRHERDPRARDHHDRDRHDRNEHERKRRREGTNRRSLTDLKSMQSVANKVLAVAHLPQMRAMSPLAAMKMVMDFWRGKHPQAKAPAMEDLVKIAKEAGVGEHGVGVPQMAKIAERLRYDFAALNGSGLADLDRAIGEGIAPLALLGIDHAGDPSSVGSSLQLAVIRGVFDLDGKSFVWASHGWANAADKIWDAASFDGAWQAASRAFIKMSPMGWGG